MVGLYYNTATFSENMLIVQGWKEELSRAFLVLQNKLGEENPKALAKSNKSNIRYSARS